MKNYTVKLQQNEWSRLLSYVQEDIDEGRNYNTTNDKDIEQEITEIQTIINKVSRQVWGKPKR